MSNAVTARRIERADSVVVDDRIAALVAAIRHALPALHSAALPEEYTYSSLPLCVIDAVFSIGVRYTAVRNVVTAFCAAQSPPWPRLAADGVAERTVSAFLAATATWSADDLAARCFGGNRQRTSTRAGILKADATVAFARALAAHGIDRFADLADDDKVNRAEAAVRLIPGQGSGISFGYFLMLGGDESGVKPDRMICRFVAEALGIKDIPPPEARATLLRACAVIRNEMPELTPRLFDWCIWDYQRGRLAPVQRRP